MIYLGADHGGFELKEKIKKWLSDWKYPWEDLGAKTFDSDDDYPQFAFAVAQKVVKEENTLKFTTGDTRGRAPDSADEQSEEHWREGQHVAGPVNSNSEFTTGDTRGRVTNSKVTSPTDQNFGILACRSAAGMVIAANRIKGARAVVAFSKENVIHSRSHNDANILALAGQWPDEHLQEFIKLWLETPFSNEERHVRRIKQLDL